MIIKNLRPFPFNSVFLKHLNCFDLFSYWHNFTLKFSNYILVVLFRALLIHQFQVYEVSSGYWHFIRGELNNVQLSQTATFFHGLPPPQLFFLLFFFHLPTFKFFPEEKKTHHIAVSFWNILYLPVFLQACRCWSRGPSPGPSSSRRASERGVSGKYGGVSGVGRRWLWRSSPPVRSAPGSARLRSTRLWCWDTRTFWASSLLTTKVRRLRIWAAGLRYNCTSSCGERLVGI